MHHHHRSRRDHLLHSALALLALIALAIAPGCDGAHGQETSPEAVGGPSGVAAPPAAPDQPSGGVVPPAAPEEATPAAPPTRPAAQEEAPPSFEELSRSYRWLEGRQGEEEFEGLTTLERRFAPPAGFTRVELASDSFGAYLRGLPLLADRRRVRAFDGSPLGSPAAAVVPIDVGSRDLQQCADSIIRLHAEYLWGRQQHDEIAYHFTSGDLVRFADWAAGERIRVRGNGITRSKGEARGKSHRSLRRYLDLIFMYAGTRSLHREATRAAITEALPGDFLLQGGSPGHTVLLLDVATNPDGRRVALIGQGFMPAQEFHVVRSSSALDGVWFLLPRGEDGQVATPSWRPFGGGELWRF